MNRMKLEKSLDQILKESWAALVAGAQSAKSDYHLATIATADDDGLPEARTVVLRRAKPSARLLAFHTDARAPKVAQIRARPDIAWHFYSREDRVQLRLRSIATVHAGDDAAREAFEGSRLSSRRCYLAPHPPGSPADGPSGNLPTWVEDRVPEETEAAPGFANFALITAQVTELDWLWLASKGHRRARFRWEGDRCASTWVHP